MHFVYETAFTSAEAMVNENAQFTNLFQIPHTHIHAHIHSSRVRLVNFSHNRRAYNTNRMITYQVNGIT